MKIERAVVNASPLILMFKSGLADLLPRLCRLQKLRGAGLWLSEELVTLLKEQAGESD